MLVTCQRRMLDLYQKPYRKINSKWFDNQNVKSKTIKLLEENIGKSPRTLTLTMIY